MASYSVSLTHVQLLTQGSFSALLTDSFLCRSLFPSSATTPPGLCSVHARPLSPRSFIKIWTARCVYPKDIWNCPPRPSSCCYQAPGFSNTAFGCFLLKHRGRLDGKVRPVFSVFVSCFQGALIRWTEFQGALSLWADLFEHKLAPVSEACLSLLDFEIAVLTSLRWQRLFLPI